jgi:hypothetical protein
MSVGKTSHTVRDRKIIFFKFRIFFNFRRFLNKIHPIWLAAAGWSLENESLSIFVDTPPPQPLLVFLCYEQVGFFCRGRPPVVLESAVKNAVDLKRRTMAMMAKNDIHHRYYFTLHKDDGGMTSVHAAKMGS